MNPNQARNMQDGECQTVVHLLSIYWALTLEVWPILSSHWAL